MGKKIWEILKRILLGAAAWFATLTALVILWTTIYPGRKTYSDWYVLIMFFLPLGVALKVALRGLKIQIARKAPKPQSAAVPIPAPAKPEPPKPEPPKPEPPKPEPPKSEPPKSEPPRPAEPAQPEGTTYLVAGVSFREQDILEMADESDEYTWSKKEIIDECYTNDKLWRYYWDPKQVELVPEPDNQYDPNAVKVMVDGVHIGYIKKGSCKHVLRLLEEDRIRRITCTIGGGPYKVVWEEYDDEKDRDVYTLEKDESPIWAKLKIVEEEG